MNEFLVSWQVERGFTPIRELYELIGDRGYIAGSYAAWMSGGFDFTPNDIDIFATTDDNALAIYDECRTVFSLGIGTRTSVARSLFPYSTSQIQYPLQIVNPNPSWVNFPHDIIESFDMDVSRAVLMSPDRLLIDTNVGQNQAKFLRINDPLRSLKRAIKYGARGFEFGDRELIKLFMCWDAIGDVKRDTIIQAVYGGAGDEQTDDDDDDDDEFWEGYNQDEDDYFSGE